MRVLVGRKDGDTPIRVSGVEGVWVQSAEDEDGKPGDLVLYMSDGCTLTVPLENWDRCLLLRVDPQCTVQGTIHTAAPGAGEEGK
jgi:hypothetical protein